MDAFIGDEQSLEDNVSTFTAQIQHLAKAWKHLDSTGLVLLDEFGAGTDPAQGAALAQGVLDGLLDKQTFVAGRHPLPGPQDLCPVARRRAGRFGALRPAEQEAPFQTGLRSGGRQPGPGRGREHGLPESILRRAEHYLLQDGQDTSALLGRLNALAAEREQEIARLRQEQEKARRDTQIMREKTEKERLRLHDEVRAKAGELMRAWKEGRATHKQALKEMSRLRADLAAPWCRKRPRCCRRSNISRPASRSSIPCSTSAAW